VSEVLSRKLRALAAFIWDFIVGDDWRLAAGVVIGLGVTALAADLGTAAWWLLPALAAAILAVSVWRASRMAR
jgi:hypothetical protein